MTPPTILSIAASDSFAAAGVQADVKTALALGAYCSTAITAVTAQNSFTVDAVQPVPADLLSAQLNAIFSGFSPRLPSGPLAAIKIGLLNHQDTLSAVVPFLKSHAVDTPIVLDTVLGASSGNTLFPLSLLPEYIETLIPLATLITPNLDEAALLLGGERARNVEQMHSQALALMALGARAVLLKGGHLEGDVSMDVLVTPTEQLLFSAPKIATENSRGTGCTLSTAIAVGLARGEDIVEAVGSAKGYVCAALRGAAQWQLVSGCGPVNHRVTKMPLKPPVPLSSAFESEEGAEGEVEGI